MSRVVSRESWQGDGISLYPSESRKGGCSFGQGALTSAPAWGSAGLPACVLAAKSAEKASASWHTANSQNPDG